MEMDPREWGRIAQGVLILWILLTLPRIVPVESTAELLGSVVGLLVGAILFVGLPRALIVYIGNRGDDGNSTTS